MMAVISRMRVSRFYCPAVRYRQRRSYLDGAHRGSRTPDLPLTRRLLYQLSYAGVPAILGATVLGFELSQPGHPWPGVQRHEHTLSMFVKPPLHPTELCGLRPKCVGIIILCRCASDS